MTDKFTDRLNGYLKKYLVPEILSDEMLKSVEPHSPETSDVKDKNFTNWSRIIFGSTKIKKTMNKLLEHLGHAGCRNGLLLGLTGLLLLLGVDVGVNLLHWGLVLVGLNTLLSRHWSKL